MYFTLRPADAILGENTSITPKATSARSER